MTAVAVFIEDLVFTDLCKTYGIISSMLVL